MFARCFSRILHASLNILLDLINHHASAQKGYFKYLSAVTYWKGKIKFLMSSVSGKCKDHLLARRQILIFKFSKSVPKIYFPVGNIYYNEPVEDGEPATFNFLLLWEQRPSKKTSIWKHEIQVRLTHLLKIESQKFNLRLNILAVWQMHSRAWNISLGNYYKRTIVLLF